MLAGLRWPGQTVVGLWPCAFDLKYLVQKTESLTSIGSKIINHVVHETQHIAVACMLRYAEHLFNDNIWNQKWGTGSRVDAVRIAIQHAIQNLSTAIEWYKKADPIEFGKFLIGEKADRYWDIICVEGDERLDAMMQFPRSILRGMPIICLTSPSHERL
eukprot:s2332_g8.t1